MISKILSLDWALLFFWIVATTLGWSLGGLILSGLQPVTSGFLIGVFQWLVLQGRITRPWRWIIVTILGWVLGYLLAFFTLPQELTGWEGAVIGLSAGFAQWLILRQEVHWAGWWIIFSLIGWITGLTLLPGVLLTGTMAGTLTGIPLEILLRYPKPRATQQGIT